VPLPTITPYGDILAGYFEDPNFNFLIIVTTVYLIISIYAESNSYVECLTIYLGLFFQALIASLCDHSKNKQFLGLKDEINKEKVTVYRGAYGTTESIRTKNLVVGDIIHVQQGDRVPADCILVEEMNITVDQTMYHKDMANCEKSLSFQISPEEHKY
jgi:magnesium-transporting ATPase (P-type)